MGVVCVGGVGIRRLSGCGVCGWGGDQETEWVCVGGVGIRRLSGLRLLLYLPEEM